MEKVKERMKQLKDAIEDAQQRETDAKNAIKKLDAKVDIWEGEKTTLLSRIIVVKAEHEKISERLEEREAKLDDAESRTEESEVRRKQLAETEVDDFERSEEIESTLKAATVSKENADHLLVDAERKEIILEGDVARIQEKYEKFTVQVDDLQERLDSYTSEIRELEENDREASDRESVSEEKMKFLEKQIREVVSTAETHERNVGKQERLRDKLSDEICTWKDRREEIRHEMEEAMGGLLDDD